MFRATLCPSSGAAYCCTCSLWSPCGVGSDVFSSLVRVPIIRSFLLLHMQSLVTVWCLFRCFLQPCLCARHQELPTAAHEVSGHRVVLVPMFPSSLVRFLVMLWCVFVAWYTTPRTHTLLSILNMHTLHFSLQNARLFHCATSLGSCIIHILHTGCAKI
jgi:hypothetical protein